MPVEAALRVACQPQCVDPAQSNLKLFIAEMSDGEHKPAGKLGFVRVQALTRTDPPLCLHHPRWFSLLFRA